MLRKKPYKVSEVKEKKKQKQGKIQKRNKTRVHNLAR